VIGAAIAAFALIRGAIDDWVDIMAGGVPIVGDLTEKIEELGGEAEGTGDEMSEAAMKTTRALQEAREEFRETLADIIWRHQDTIARIKEQIEDLTLAFKEANRKRFRDFKRNLAELLRSHKKTMQSIREQMMDEEEKYKKQMEERKEYWKDRMDDLTYRHEKKVKEIKEQIAKELDAGRSADSKKVKSLQEALDEEMEEYGHYFSELEEERDKDLTEIEEEHKERLEDLRESLEEEKEEYRRARQERIRDYREETREREIQFNRQLAEFKEELREERAFLRKHHNIVAAVNKMYRMDEIEEATKAHNKRIRQIKEQGKELKKMATDTTANFRKMNEKITELYSDMLTDIEKKTEKTFGKKSWWRRAWEDFVAGLKIIKESLPRILARWTLGEVFRPFFLKGGQYGIPYVPQTGPYLLHKGETVLPRWEARKARGITVNIYGGYYLDREAAEKIGDTIIDKLRYNIKF